MKRTIYIRTGTGPSETTATGSADDPLRVSYNPNTGTGVTLDACVRAHGEVNYVLDEGVYFSRNLVLPTGVSITGAGSDKTVIQQIETQGILIGQYPPIGTINRTTFSGFCLELNRAGLFASGLQVFGDGIRVRDVGVRYAGGNFESGAESFPIFISSRRYGNSNIYRPEAIKPNIVEECWVTNFVPDGEWRPTGQPAVYATAILVDCVPGCLGRIENCRVAGSTGAFLHAAFAGSSVLVRGNYAAYARSLFYGDTYDSQDIVIEHNRSFQLWTGVLLVMADPYSCREIIVRDNHFHLRRGEGYGCYGVFANGVDTLRVVSNTITMDTEQEKVRVPLGVVALSKKDCKNVMVFNNRYVIPNRQLGIVRQPRDYLQRNCTNVAAGDNVLMCGLQNEQMYADSLQAG